MVHVQSVRSLVGTVNGPCLPMVSHSMHSIPVVACGASIVACGAPIAAHGS